MVLLHGFPTSSHYFRDVLPRLGASTYVVAPDLPGSGFSDAPAVEDYDYSFDRFSHVVETLLGELGVTSYVLYVTDFGTPVGYRLAMRHPHRVLGLVVQNGNAHEDGLGAVWDAPRRYWADPTPENRAALPEWLNPDGVRDEYLSGLPPELRDLHPREAWHLDWARISRPGQLEAQFQLFYDYRHHVAGFGDIADYHQTYRPPSLVLWGRHDDYFQIEEVLAYHRVLNQLDARIYDAGHMLLETHASEAAEALTTFLDDISSARWEPR